VQAAIRSARDAAQARVYELESLLAECSPQEEPEAIAEEA